MARTGQSAAFLKRLRKKYKLGEFAGKKRSRGRRKKSVAAMIRSLK